MNKGIGLISSFVEDMHIGEVKWKMLRPLLDIHSDIRFNGHQPEAEKGKRISDVLIRLFS